MSVIIRLQNLPWSANSYDIRQFFHGCTIPEGGVHIVGGELGDAFIAFSTDEDARQAMMRSGGKLKEVQVVLMLSSRSEMQKVIEAARAVSFPPAPVPQQPALPLGMQQAQAVAPLVTPQIQIQPSVVQRSNSKEEEDIRRKPRRSRSTSRDRSRTHNKDSRRRRSRSRSRDRRRRRSTSRGRGRDRYGRDIEKREEFKRDKELSKEKDDDRSKTDLFSRQSTAKSAPVDPFNNQPQPGAFIDLESNSVQGDLFGQQQQRISGGVFPSVDAKGGSLDAYDQSSVGHMDRGLKQQNFDNFGAQQQILNAGFLQLDQKPDPFSQALMAGSLMQRDPKFGGIYSGQPGMAGGMMQRDNQPVMPVMYGQQQQGMDMASKSGENYPNQQGGGHFGRDTDPFGQGGGNFDQFGQQQRGMMGRDGGMNTGAYNQQGVVPGMMQRDVGPTDSYAQQKQLVEGAFPLLNKPGSFADQLGRFNNPAGAFNQKDSKLGGADPFMKGNTPVEDPLTIAMKKTLSAFKDDKRFIGNSDHDRSPPRNTRNPQGYPDISSAFDQGSNHSADMGNPMLQQNNMGQQWNNRMPLDGSGFGMGMNTTGMIPNNMGMNMSAMGNAGRNMPNMSSPVMPIGNMMNSGMGMGQAMNPAMGMHGMPGRNMGGGGMMGMDGGIGNKRPMDSDDRDVRMRRNRDDDIVDDMDETSGPDDFRPRFNIAARDRGGDANFGGPSRFQRGGQNMGDRPNGKPNRFDGAIGDGRGGGFNNRNCFEPHDAMTNLDSPFDRQKPRDERGSRRDRSPFDRGQRDDRNDRGIRREDQGSFDRGHREDGRPPFDRARRHGESDRGGRRDGPPREEPYQDDRDKSKRFGRQSRPYEQGNITGLCVEVLGCPRTDYSAIRRAFNMNHCQVSDIKFDDSQGSRRIAVRFQTQPSKVNAIKKGSIFIADVDCSIVHFPDEAFENFANEVRGRRNDGKESESDSKTPKVVHLRVKDIPENVTMADLVKILSSVKIERSAFLQNSRGSAAFFKFSNDFDAKRAMLSIKDSKYKAEFITSKEFELACEEWENTRRSKESKNDLEKKEPGTVQSKDSKENLNVEVAKPVLVGPERKPEPGKVAERVKSPERPVQKTPLMNMDFDQFTPRLGGGGGGIVTTCVLLEQLPFNASDRDICDFFSDVGLVPSAIHIMLGPDGRPAGDAFVEFLNPDLANRALQKNGAPLGRQSVSVRLVSRNEMIEALEGPEPSNFPPAMPAPFVRQGQPPPDVVVTMENIPYAADTDEILSFFGNSFDIGPQDVFRKLNERGMNTAFARVVMSSPDEALRAVNALNLRQIRGRTIRLNILARA